MNYWMQGILDYHKLDQARQRYFTISHLDGEEFDFSDLVKTEPKNVWDFIQDDEEVGDHYTITAPSMKAKIDPTNFDNAPLKTLSVIRNQVFTITGKQNRCPNSGIIQRKNGEWRLLTELECWRLQGYTDEDYYRALEANPGKKGKQNGALYLQAGNSIPIPILEAIFKKMLFNETQTSKAAQLRLFS